MADKIVECMECGKRFETVAESMEHEHMTQPAPIAPNGVPAGVPVAIPYVPDPDPAPGIHSIPHTVDPYELAEPAEYPYCVAIDFVLAHAFVPGTKAEATELDNELAEFCGRRAEDPIHERPKCNAPNPYPINGRCTKTAGHEDSVDPLAAEHDNGWSTWTTENLARQAEELRVAVEAAADQVLRLVPDSLAAMVARAEAETAARRALGDAA